MKVAVGSDHRGYAIKQRIVGVLRQLGHEVHDLGTSSNEASVDYPDYAFQVAEMVGHKQVERGILICSTGIGMSIAANKVPGVRAALCYDSITAEVSRRHNDANVMCLSADLLGEDLIDRMVRLWVTVEFEGGRHARRITKIGEFEKKTDSKNK